MKKLYPVLIILALLFVFTFGCTFDFDNQDLTVGKQTVMPQEYEFDSIIVKFKDASLDRAASVPGLDKHGVLEKTYTLDSMGNYGVIKLNTPVKSMVTEGQNVLEILEYYNSLPEVEYAEPNFIMTAYGTPNDPYYQYQWDMAQLNMPDAWDLSTGSNVVVAIIDTGVCYRSGSSSGVAPDLAETNFVTGYDFINSDNYADDDNGHGTHVCGTIAQSTNNSVGVTGMAYNATIMPIKALSAAGSGSIDGISQAIIWAADHGAQVINMSLGGGGFSQTMYDACEYAYNNGVVIIAASGNDSTSTVSYPAAYDEFVIAVGATRYDKTRCSYSNYGSSLDVVAPGGDTSVDQSGDGYVDGILQQTIAGYNSSTGTTDYTFGYYFYQGTSMATPHVVGLAALLLAVKQSATPDEIRDAIQDTCEDLGTSGWDSYYGYGLIDPVAAIEQILNITDPEDPEDPGDLVYVTKSVNGTLKYTNDRSDSFIISVAGGTIDLSLTFNYADIDLYLYNPSGTLVAKSDGTTNTESISYDTNDVSGNYTITVYMYSTYYRYSKISYTLTATWAYLNNDSLTEQ